MKTPPQLLIGYARVSTRDQSLEAQVAALKRRGVADRDVYLEKLSGASKKRPQLIAALKGCRPGSRLVVYKLDRLWRDIGEMIALVKELRARDVVIESLTEHFDSTTAIGKFHFGLIALMGEFERDLTIERTKAGLEYARSQGRLGGADRVLSEAAERRIARAYWRRPKGKRYRAWVEELADKNDVSTGTIFNIQKRYPEEKPDGK
jgi:DNA invertase Pin-like site-specific DNA recombinase